MLRGFLQAKIYPVKVTGKRLEYDGSLGLSREMLDASGLAPGQVITVVNMSNGARFETYIIEGKEGICELNGGAARLGEIGDQLIVMAMVYLGPDESLTPRIVKVDENNHPAGKK